MLSDTLEFRLLKTQDLLLVFLLLKIIRLLFSTLRIPVLTFQMSNVHSILNLFLTFFSPVRNQNGSNPIIVTLNRLQVIAFTVPSFA